MQTVAYLVITPHGSLLGIYPTEARAEQGCAEAIAAGSVVVMVSNPKDRTLNGKLARRVGGLRKQLRNHYTGQDSVLRRQHEAALKDLYLEIQALPHMNGHVCLWCGRDVDAPKGAHEATCLMQRARLYVVQHAR